MDIVVDITPGSGLQALPPNFWQPSQRNLDSFISAHVISRHSFASVKNRRRQEPTLVCSKTTRRSIENPMKAI